MIIGANYAAAGGRGGGGGGPSRGARTRCCAPT